MKISTIIQAIDRVFPRASAGFEKDAVGLQVGVEEGTDISSVLVAHEITSDVVDEAIACKADLIVAYHPLIFPEIRSVTDATRTGTLLRRLIRQNIGLYILHTCFDAHPSLGTSALMAKALGITKTEILSPLSERLEKIVVFVPSTHASIVKEAMWQAGAGGIGNYDECSFTSEGVCTFRGNETSNPTIGKPLERMTVSEERIEMIVERWKAESVISAMIEAHPYEEVAYDRYPLMNSHPNFGMGSIGNLPEPMDTDTLLRSVQRQFGIPVTRFNKCERSLHSRIALLGGAGMSFYSAARRAGADAYITGDIRYHDFYRAEHDGLLLIDAGHAETEAFVRHGMYNAVLSVIEAEDLQKSAPRPHVVESGIMPNAVNYHL